VATNAGEIRSRVWKDGKVIVENFPFEEISDYLERDDCVVWVDVCDPDHARLNKLADELALDPLAVEDAIDNLERTKAIRYKNYTVLTAYAALMSENVDPAAQSNLHFARVSAFVLPRGLITVSQPEGFDVEAVLARWDESEDLIAYGVGALLHGLLDVIVDGHFDAVQTLDDAIEKQEDGLFDQEVRTADIQRRTYQIRKDLVQLRRIALPMRELVNTVLRHRKDVNSPAELDASYDDLYDHVLRVTEWTESLRDMVTTMFETNLSLQDARLNTVMKKLTGWAAIIAVPTAVTGFFGQNVPYPGFSHESGFIASLVLMIGIALALYVTFRRKDWL
jgi:magnesium transporter